MPCIQAWVSGWSEWKWQTESGGRRPWTVRSAPVSGRKELGDASSPRWEELRWASTSDREKHMPRRYEQQRLKRQKQSRARPKQMHSAADVKAYSSKIVKEPTVILFAVIAAHIAHSALTAFLPFFPLLLRLVIVVICSLHRVFGRLFGVHLHLVV